MGYRVGKLSPPQRAEMADGEHELQAYEPPTRSSRANERHELAGRRARLNDRARTPGRISTRIGAALREVHRAPSCSTPVARERRRPAKIGMPRGSRRGLIGVFLGRQEGGRQALEMRSAIRKLEIDCAAVGLRARLLTRRGHRASRSRACARAAASRSALRPSEPTGHSGRLCRR